MLSQIDTKPELHCSHHYNYSEESISIFARLDPSFATHTRILHEAVAVKIKQVASPTLFFILDGHRWFVSTSSYGIK